MKCNLCDVTTDALFRVNPEGVKGVWACKECRDYEYPETRDPLVDDVVATLRKGF